MDNVIPIEELPEFIGATIAKVSEGVALARRRGILAELPKEVQFDVTVIQKWQSPDFVIVSTDTTKGSDTGTSTSTSTQKGTSKRVDEGSSSDSGTSQQQTNVAGQNNSYTITEN